MPKRHRDKSLVWSHDDPRLEKTRDWVFSEEYDALFWECVNNTRPQSREYASAAVRRLQHTYECVHRNLDCCPETDQITHGRLEVLYELLIDRLVSVYKWLKGNPWPACKQGVQCEAYQNHDCGSAKVHDAYTGNGNAVRGPQLHPQTPKGGR